MSRTDLGLQKASKLLRAIPWKLVKTSVARPRHTLPLDGRIQQRWYFDLNVPNLIRALAAIVFWSLVIGAAAICYELWRLEHSWSWTPSHEHFRCDPCP